jgi:CRISPR-associated endonuclease/helicase Cas3
MSSLPDFGAFFRQLWGYDPFPWQAMLAERVVEGAWPLALDLPTAAGKTACIDVAVYALASQAERAVQERTAPRRIWFVVDRRIVVDAAHDRAHALARKLEDARHGPLRLIADRLRRVADTDRALAVARLRGGILRDDGWARVPSQPAVISTTVDQIGSRLLFRAYGPGQLAAPIYAGLAANDSLVILDEAHCSVPFLQTLRAVDRFRSDAWAELPLATPFSFVVLSATPPADLPESATFPGAERDRALDDPVLARRLRASKVAELIEVKGRSGHVPDALVSEAVERAHSYVRAGRRRVGIMVNRVRTAEAVAHALRTQLGGDADTVLLTGRIRPFERDRLVERWMPFLQAASPSDSPRPVVVVSTQCLEVGADFSFDALVSEAASLDALRQRFGRLARMGAVEPAPAAILARARDVAGPPDPIYGAALAETWRLLRERASRTEDGRHTKETLDFGVEALAQTLGDLEDLSPYLAPTADAPVLLPAHLDLLCQTAPVPFAEPDLQLFLHGKDGGSPEAQVVWRADLSANEPGTWLETVALCRPTSGEMLSVPLDRLRAWLVRPDSGDDSSDIEGPGAAPAGEWPPRRARPYLLWRGRDRSRIVTAASEIGPGDVVVVPAEYGIDGLGHSAPEQALGDRQLDLWEPAWAGAGHAAVRLHRSVLVPWLGCPQVADLVALAEHPVPDREAIRDAIDTLLADRPKGDEDAPPPDAWWLALLRRTRNGRVEAHPRGGVILFARESATTARANEPDMFADDDDLTSAAGLEIPLDDHCRLVERTVDKLVARCLPPKLAEPLRLAARWHDAGKLDERFQIWLRDGDELAVLRADRPIAKSALGFTSPARSRAVREASGLPDNFRHELLSVQILQQHGLLPEESEAAELVLHLVASHHGHARPFAPISDDPEATEVRGWLGDLHIELAADDRRRLPQPHRLDSGLAERFWRLGRRYGWWGIAYLEAILRLADWYASRLAEGDPETVDLLPAER